MVVAKVAVAVEVEMVPSLMVSACVCDYADTEVGIPPNNNNNNNNLVPPPLKGGGIKNDNVTVIICEVPVADYQN